MAAKKTTDFGFNTPTQKPFLIEVTKDGLAPSVFCMPWASTLLAAIAA